MRTSAGPRAAASSILAPSRHPSASPRARADRPDGLVGDDERRRHRGRPPASRPAAASTVSVRSSSRAPPPSLRGSRSGRGLPRARARSSPRASEASRQKSAGARSARRSRTGSRRPGAWRPRPRPCRRPSRCAATFCAAIDQRSCGSRAASSAVKGGATTSSGIRAAPILAERRSAHARAPARVMNSSSSWRRRGGALTARAPRSREGSRSSETRERRRRPSRHVRSATRLPQRSRRPRSRRLPLP